MSQPKSMAEEPSIERLRQLFFVDEENGVLRWAVAVNSRVKVGCRAGCVADKGYIIVGVDGRTCKAHRIVFAMAHGYYPRQVDHINGNPSDNRTCNLRAADPSTNSHNSRTPRTNTSGIKGVYFDKRRGRWEARLMAGGKIHWIGGFASPQAAADAVRFERQRLHKEFARHE